MAKSSRRKGRSRSPSNRGSSTSVPAGERFGREQGLRLLELSISAKSIAVPRDHKEPLLAYAAWTVRARTLLTAIYMLVDRGHRTEAGIISRALLETAITMRWVALDGRKHYESWVLTDCRKDVTWDTKIQHAATTSPSWSHPDRLPDGYMDDVRATIADLERRRVPGAPDIRQMAEQVGYFDAHPILYRLYNGMVHGSMMMVLDHLAHPLGEDEYIVSEPTLGDSHMNGHPYWMPALLLIDVLKVSCDTLGFSGSPTWRESKPFSGQAQEVATTLRRSGAAPSEWAPSRVRDHPPHPSNRRHELQQTSSTEPGEDQSLQQTRSGLTSGASPAEVDIFTAICDGRAHPASR